MSQMVTGSLRHDGEHGGGNMGKTQIPTKPPRWTLGQLVPWGQGAETPTCP